MDYNDVRNIVSAGISNKETLEEIEYLLTKCEEQGMSINESVIFIIDNLNDDYHNKGIIKQLEKYNGETASSIK